MRRLVIVLLMVFLAVNGSAVNAGSGLYKCEDPNGLIVYTDNPCTDGEELELPPIQTYSTPPIKNYSSGKNKENKDEETANYESLTIVTPKNDKTIISSAGTVNIGFELKPLLKTDKGHLFAISLDGKQQPAKGVVTRITLSNVDRGTHTAQVSVIDSKGNVQITSASVTFHLKRSTVYEGASADTSDPNLTDQGTLKSPKAPGAQQAPRAPVPMPRIPKAK